MHVRATPGVVRGLGEMANLGMCAASSMPPNAGIGADAGSNQVVVATVTRGTITDSKLSITCNRIRILNYSSG